MSTQHKILSQQWCSSSRVEPQYVGLVCVQLEMGKDHWRERDPDQMIAVHTRSPVCVCSAFTCVYMCSVFLVCGCVCVCEVCMCRGPDITIQLCCRCHT